MDRNDANNEACDVKYPLVVCYIAIEHDRKDGGFCQLQNGDFPQLC